MKWRTLLSNTIQFRPYVPTDRELCLEVFDANTPKFFVPDERLDYSSFLDANPVGYEVCLSGNKIIGAFGLIGCEAGYSNIHWILISPKLQGEGVGSMIMKRAISIGHKEKLAHIKIAASHLSAPFFEKYGAECITEIKDGWGLGMHRVDMELQL
jgi:ribosomal protein S18 acetylase RimI-like enzyme